MPFLKHLLAVLFLAVYIPYSEGIALPAGCESSDFCTIRPPEYDYYEIIINELMQKANDQIPSFPDVISNCIVDDQGVLETDQNCDSTTKTITPYLMPNSSTKLIVQSGFYQQKFSVTNCNNYLTGMDGDGSQCLDKVIVPQSLTYKASCKTIQGEIKLYVYDIEEKKLQRVPMYIDVCCSCLITSKEDM